MKSMLTIFIIALSINPALAKRTTEFSSLDALHGIEQSRLCVNRAGTQMCRPPKGVTAYFVGEICYCQFRGTRLWDGSFYQGTAVKRPKLNIKIE